MNRPSAQPQDPTSRSDSSQQQKTTKTKSRRKSFYLLAILLGLTPLLLLEAGLRIFGVAADAADTDLHAGFGKSSALFELDEAAQEYRTGLGREQFFVPTGFASDKPEDEFRIFCLGGSTVQGRPYLPDTSFSQWLELELNAIDDSKNYNVINCGGISYASYRLRPIVEEVMNYQPDMVIVATGHNEFLEDKTYAEVKTRSGARMWFEDQAKSLRTVMLLRKMVGGEARVEPKTETQPSAETLDTRLDDPSGYASYHRDDEWHNDICEQYDRSVNAMIDTCSSSGVPLVLVKLGANLRDCPPFKSEHSTELSVSDEQQWQVLFDEATFLDKTDPEAALTVYLQALQLDDEYPLLHFRIARCYDFLAKFEEAKTHYQSALNLDVCPLRMCEEIADSLARIALQKNVPLVDAAAAIEQLGPEQICGFESYIDHVHPTIKAHQVIAAQIAKTMTDQNFVSASKGLSPNDRRTLHKNFINQLDATYYSNGRRRIGWLEGWAQRKRLADETVPVDTRSFVAATIREIDLHRFTAAQDFISMALSFDESAETLFLKQSVNFFQQGRNTESKWLLNELQQQKVSVAALKSVRLGLLIIAHDSNDTDAKNEVLNTYPDQWDQIIKDDTSGWNSAVPDVPTLAQEI